MTLISTDIKRHAIAYWFFQTGCFSLVCGHYLGPHGPFRSSGRHLHHPGVTSIIRDLYLHPRDYETLIHFFRSSAWSLESLRLTWLQVVQRIAPLFRIQDRMVLVGDGMK